MKNGGRKYKRGYYDGRALDGRALGNAIAFNSIAGKDVADTLPVYNLNDPTKVNKYIVSFSQPQVNNKPDLSNPVQPRKNFNETAFFFPDLRTDSSGNIEFSFTMPEALTKWKFQTLAHTKDVAFGLS